MSGTFDDLLAANAEFAAGFDLDSLDGVARAGIAVVTCMDSRIDPIGMVGLRPGDAKVLRNPGGRADDRTMTALILGVHLLGVKRILVVPHTRCAMAVDEAALQSRVREASGALDVPTFGATDDQIGALRDDVSRVREHPLIPDSVAVGGFLYDVDTGRLTHKV